MRQRYVDLDLVCEDELLGTLYERNDVQYLVDKIVLANDLAHGEILQLDGPAGAWPVVRFTGSEEAVARLIKKYDDAEELI